MDILKTNKKTFIAALILLSLIAFGIFNFIQSPARFVKKLQAGEVLEFSLWAQNEFNNNQVIIPVNQLPSSWRADVLSARYYINGVMLELSNTKTHSKGFFISWDDEEPYSGSGITFKKFNGNIYTYKEKTRRRK